MFKKKISILDIAKIQNWPNWKKWISHGASHGKKNLNSMTNIEISEDNKEESAKKHQKIISKFQKDQHDNRIIIYTDGSKSETNQIGAGLVYTTNFSCYQ